MGSTFELTDGSVLAKLRAMTLDIQGDPMGLCTEIFVPKELLVFLWAPQRDPEM